MADKIKISDFLHRIKSAFDAGQLDVAIDILSEAVKSVMKTSNLSPSETFLWEKFGVHLILMGEMEQLADLMPKMLKMHPWNSDVHSHMLYSLLHLPEIDQQIIFDEHKQWAQIHAPANNVKDFHDNDADPDRILRIGYISPNFCMHSVAFFIEPLLNNHNRKNVEVYGYGNVAKPEATTEILKSKFDFYRNIFGLDAQSLINLIREDKIDILVEFAGHTEGNSLIALANKPAPIQVSYLGYPATTGMEQIDYRFTDAIADLPQSQKFYTEELIYLPKGFLCYSPSELAPPPGPLPAETKGYITFGSFNNNSKINPFAIELWSKILKANSNSRFLMKFNGGNKEPLKNHYLRQFERYGINPQRIEISGWTSRAEHFELYKQMDIALDTYPYNGATTTCEALWMGVPVISLVGENHVSRTGLSLLNQVGLEFFAAKTAEEYVAKAIALDQNYQSLAKIRASIRQRMLSSNLCNSKEFASTVEDAYRKMWHKWCKNQGTKMSRKKTKSTQIIPSSEPAGIIQEPKAKRGIIYMIWGNEEKHEQTLQKSIASVREYHPELPIHIERLETGGKINKTRICDLSPFEETAFLDNDTVVMGRLDFGFEKARQFGLSCVINECPWARRYSDPRLSGDVVEYNSGVLFFTKKAKPVFNTWEKLFPTTNASIIHIQNDKNCLMPVADQGSFALAIEQTGFLPFVLPYNWNFRPQFYRSCYGPIKIWHSYHNIPEVLLDWNKNQSAKDAVVRFFLLDMAARNNCNLATLTV